VTVPDDDWRRIQLGSYWEGLTFTWKNYQAMTGQWEHEHCICWHTFLDPNYGEASRTAVSEDPESYSSAGYTNLARDETVAGTIWLCEECFEDFRAEYKWTVIETDPDAWPYAMPEPHPRPTAADWADPGEWLKRPE